MYAPLSTFDREQDGKIVNGSWRNKTHQQTSFLSLPRRDRRTCSDVKNIRNEFFEYFVTNGKVKW